MGATTHHLALALANSAFFGLSVATKASSVARSLELKLSGTFTGVKASEADPSR